ncbi:MAG TPA: DUF1592 domain-containing protein [Planctomycetota bacterium]|nr:DUF1592 domain-containing protein [Planctomycetota bacterium]
MPIASIRAAALVAFGLGGVVAAAADPTAVRQAFEQQVRPLMEANCLPCHHNGKAKGGLDLEPVLKEVLASTHRETWRTATAMVREREMPPAKAEHQPSDAERTTITSWITSLRALAPPDPGRVLARRLTRSEYDFTISELFGVDWHPATDFPPDDVSEGFDNQAEALGVSPLLMEKYLTAVDAILDKAIIAGQLDATWSGQELDATIGGKVVAPAAGPGTRSVTQAAEFSMQIGVPRAGRHQLKLRLAGEQVGKEPARIAVKIDGEPLGEIKAVTPLRAPAAYTISTKLEAGSHRLTITFLNPGREDTPSEPKAKDGKEAKKPDDKTKPAPEDKNKAKDKKPATDPAVPPRERTLLIESVQVTGPTAPPMPEIQKRLLFVRPGKDLPVRTAAQQIIERFAARAYRRPASSAEITLLLRIFDLADTNGEVFDEAVKLALKATLLSPQFLFRIERDRTGVQVDANGAALLDDYELASRLSYFLWSTMPDDELLTLAAQGRLQDVAVVREQVKRLLRDPRSRAFTTSFAGQWLQVRGVFGVQPDEKQFPGFDQPLRQALFDEAVLLFDTILREDRPLSDLISADYTFLNERSAAFYGITGVSGPQLRRVSLNERERGGVLGLGAVLATTSNPSRTSPVKRGKWVLEQLLDRSPPPPPADVPPLDAQPATGTSGVQLSLRQRIKRHRSDPTCAGCHASMDGIGFGLESFDPVGRLRSSDGGIPIDASGSVAGHTFQGPAGLKALLASRIDEVERSLVRKLLIYALGRGPIDADDAVIDRVIAESDQRLSSLISGIVTSYPFRYRRMGK